MSGPGPNTLNRMNSGPSQLRGMPGQQDHFQASRSLGRSSGEEAQQGSLPSATQILKILDLGVRPCLEQYLPHLSPSTWQQAGCLAPLTLNARRLSLVLSIRGLSAVAATKVSQSLIQHRSRQCYSRSCSKC